AGRLRVLALPPAGADALLGSAPRPSPQVTDGMSDLAFVGGGTDRASNWATPARLR
ncbi:MAG: hypothetical protein QOJ19_3046, partial [Acidimicrobiia bacterium]|nr:hypothetical protein [Acidimicrobiia bacterium]